MKKGNLYIIILAVAIASAVFRLINENSLEQTSLLFIGIPTLITLLVVKYAKKPKSAYGIVFLTITIFLLISGIFLGEGFICIIMMVMGVFRKIFKQRYNTLRISQWEAILRI